MPHVSRRIREQALRLLQEHRADQVAHVSTTLETHLLGTEARLTRWGNRPELAIAGLCHTAYSTTGFPQRFFEPHEREKMAHVIGEEAEEILYFYGACDRSFVYPQLIAGTEPVVYRDRFTGQTMVASETQLRTFLELTWANEIDIIARRPVVSPALRAHWHPLMAGTQSRTSDQAWTELVDLLGPPETLPAPTLPASTGTPSSAPERESFPRLDVRSLVRRPAVRRVANALRSWFGRAG